ncbi:hypothetical protein NDU88_004798 [Pleurodeles waltl]|uniref:Uncharacterized protein n=1 Tax=Pleurodeles waltl TaxID=8319 RepID=A0AAV7SJX7_PLEWA|nr:hypothetical protein NDU88_004798 [Pleurodeles waltl]
MLSARMCEVWVQCQGPPPEDPDCAARTTGGGTGDTRGGLASDWRPALDAAGGLMFPFGGTGGDLRLRGLSCGEVTVRPRDSSPCRSWDGVRLARPGPWHALQPPSLGPGECLLLCRPLLPRTHLALT